MILTKREHGVTRWSFNGTVIFFLQKEITNRCNKSQSLRKNVDFMNGYRYFANNKVKMKWVRTLASEKNINIPVISKTTNEDLFKFKISETKRVMSTVDHIF